MKRIVQEGNQRDGRGLFSPHRIMVGQGLLYRGASTVVSRIPHLLLFCLLLTACTTIDERDECCEEVVLIYRYVPLNQDEYPKHIQSMRHFLFDGDGRFVREVPSHSSSPQRLRLQRLPVGKYTMVTLANTTEAKSAISKLVPQQSMLNDFKLQVLPDGVKEASDELFWNIRTFESKLLERHTYYCDLSNIHCHLTVRVKWEGLTPDATTAKYSMELTNVASTYLLQPPLMPDIVILPDEAETDRSQSTYRQVVHRFPRGDGGDAIHQLQAPVTQLELMETFSTLRYTNQQIPTLRILKDGVLYRRAIDLSKAFQSWGLFPDQHAEQSYRILIEMKRNGEIEVHHWTGFRIVDWADGGTFGGEVGGS